MKKIINKKNIIIAASIILIAVVSIVMLLNDDSKNNTSNLNEEIIPEKIAENTEEMLNTFDKIENVDIAKDKINLSSNVTVNEVIAVWIYSEPIFLGYFEVKEGSDGELYIDGLLEAISKIDITNGNHNIALVKDDNTPIGYVGVTVTNNKEIVSSESQQEENGNEQLKEDEEESENQTEQDLVETKKITEKESIAFSNTNVLEVNMKKGTTKIKTEGENGEKTITYEITYTNGIESSRKIISEKINKEATNQVTLVGTSDYNINTDKINGYYGGLYCTLDKLVQYSDIIGCKEEGETLVEFDALVINNENYIYKLNNRELNSLISINSNKHFVYNGTTYYADDRRGDTEKYPLTYNLCDKYDLACGAW